MQQATSHDEEIRPLIDEPGVNETDVQLAIGTAEIDCLPIEIVDDDDGHRSQATFVIGPDGFIEDVDAAAETLTGYARDELLGRRFSIAAQGDSLRNSEVMQIVHDLRGPLATIALEMCLLEDKLAQRDLKSTVARVTQNIAFLDRMVQDLLDAGAVDVESFVMHRRPAELRSLVMRVIDRATATCNRGRVFLEAPTEIELNIDEVRIERVIANLLHNALKYAPITSEVLIRVELHHAFARVSVIDAGPGIRPQDTSIIFDKYRRGENGYRHDGNGLGLYVSKRIVEAHGGRIGVTSVYGVGACFFFELPVGPENT